MDNRRTFLGMAAAAGATAASLSIPGLANAASGAALDRDAASALKKLVDENAGAAALKKQAKGVLVFPSIVKAGFVFGGAYGKGVLWEGGKVKGHYASAAGSFGFQAGAQSFGYVLFLMTDKALDYLHTSKGWEVGVGPTVVVVDQGAAAALTTSTARDDAYAFVFGQQGLMAGFSLEGAKISKIKG